MIKNKKTPGKLYIVYNPKGNGIFCIKKNRPTIESGLFFGILNNEIVMLISIIERSNNSIPLNAQRLLLYKGQLLFLNAYDECNLHEITNVVT